jgi:hypothetical protein
VLVLRIIVEETEEFAIPPVLPQFYLSWQYLSLILIIKSTAIDHVYIVTDLVSFVNTIVAGSGRH